MCDVAQVLSIAASYSLSTYADDLYQLECEQTDFGLPDAANELVEVAWYSAAQYLFCGQY